MIKAWDIIGTVDAASCSYCCQEYNDIPKSGDNPANSSTMDRTAQQLLSHNSAASTWIAMKAQALDFKMKM